jgi:hypothetical protein
MPLVLSRVETADLVRPAALVEVEDEYVLPVRTFTDEYAVRDSAPIRMLDPWATVPFELADDHFDSVPFLLVTSLPFDTVVPAAPCERAAQLLFVVLPWSVERPAIDVV